MVFEKIFSEGTITSDDIPDAVSIAGQTPLYLYDERLIIDKCSDIKKMPNEFGFSPRYAMKANSTKALFQPIVERGFGIDASSMNEAERVHLGGVPYAKTMLTTQEVPEGRERKRLEMMMLGGLRYNACSVRQFNLISDFVAMQKIPISIRIHPGKGGSGESVTRDTASPYSCFGIQISELEGVLEIAKKKKVIIDGVHEHIGSGGSPEKWRASIDGFLGIVSSYVDSLPDLKKINFGGGLKQGRMPDEDSADPYELGAYARERLIEFYQSTGKKLEMEVEVGTYIMAMAGNVVTKVMDKKSTGKEGFNFIIADGGMELNSRPLLYGSEHPFAIVSRNGALLSSEYNLENLSEDSSFVPVGRCCESGDSQSLDSEGNIIPRRMAEPSFGDYFVVGGCGAYCSSMSPFNYNSQTQAPEVLKMLNGELKLIREPQTLSDVVSREI
jgi:diaminopimelate decarboxylase